MKIRIKNDAGELYFKRTPYPQYSKSYRKMLEQVQGRILEVDTDYLFTDQFNTVPIPGVSNNGMRIMDDLVEEVIDDERIGSFRCQYCGKWWHPESDEIPEICPFCNEKGYISPLDGKTPQKKETRPPLFKMLEREKPASPDSGIILSPKYGLNPAKDICPWCGNTRGIALLGKLPNDAEAPYSGIITSIEPCDSCRQLMDQGITLFEVSDSDPKNGIPQVLSDAYFTGRWIVVTEAFIDRSTKEPLKTQIKDARFALMDADIFTELIAAQQEPIVP